MVEYRQNWRLVPGGYQFFSLWKRVYTFTDIRLLAIGNGVRAATHVRYVRYRFRVVPHDATLLARQLVASRLIQIGGKRG